MKFGIFYEHQLPRPWDESSEQQLFQDALSQVELADRIGSLTAAPAEGASLTIGTRPPLPATDATERS